MVKCDGGAAGCAVDCLVEHAGGHLAVGERRSFYLTAPDDELILVGEADGNTALTLKIPPT